MSIKTRNELKSSFKRGSIPKEDDFFNLIDSLVHREDDSLFNKDDGLRLTPSGISDKMVSFLNSISEKTPVWVLKGFKKSKNSDIYGLDLLNYNGESALYINPEGDIGIGKNDPDCKLDINGNIKFNGRKGNFASGTVLADGQWHKIITNLNDCNLFEIVAKMNKYRMGVHSILYSIAANAFNGKGKDIKTIDAYYDSYKDKIELKWSGDTFNYNLEIRSRRNQGEGVLIHYNVSTLWF